MGKKLIVIKNHRPGTTITDWFVMHGKVSVAGPYKTKEEANAVRYDMEREADIVEYDNNNFPY